MRFLQVLLEMKYGALFSAVLAWLWTRSARMGDHSEHCPLSTQRPSDLLLDFEIIDGGSQWSFSYIADRMDGVREANISVWNDAQFASALPNSQFVWTSLWEGNLVTNPDSKTARRQLTKLGRTCGHIVFTYAGLNHHDMLSGFNHHQRRIEDLCAFRIPMQLYGIGAKMQQETKLSRSVQASLVTPQTITSRHVSSCTVVSYPSASNYNPPPSASVRGTHSRQQNNVFSIFFCAVRSSLTRVQLQRVRTLPKKSLCRCYVSRCRIVQSWSHTPRRCALYNILQLLAHPS